MDKSIQKAITSVGDIIKDPKNKNAIIASSIAYMVSGENKERNALIAGLLAFAVLDNEEES